MLTMWVAVLVTAVVAVGAVVWWTSSDGAVPGPEAWEASDGDIHRGVAYGDGEFEQLDLYVPAGLDARAPQAAMLFIHGGSWTAGSRTDMDDAAKRYAKDGFITASMDYDLFRDGHPEVTFWLMLDQIGAAIEQVATTSAELGHDVDEIALAGTSAGAYLAQLYAYSRPDAAPLPIRFVFTQVGGGSFDPDVRGADAQRTATLVSRATGRDVTAAMVQSGAADGAIASISPVTFVGSDTVPTIHGFGGRDDVAPLALGQLLEERLGGAGVPNELIVFPESRHTLEADADVHRRYHRTVLEYAARYFRP